MGQRCRAAVIAVVLAGAGGIATAQDSATGAEEFRLHCAACHGLEGRGDGPVAAVLNAPPKNLARLSADNDGSYPFERIYAVIDGRRAVEGHGTEDMPVWGARYRTEAVEDVGPNMKLVEAVIEGRILSLVYYLQTLQADDG